MMMNESKRLLNQKDVHKQGEFNTDQNYEQMYDVFNLEILGHYLRHHYVVCVGAGPSLDDNIEILKKVQDKVYIFTCLQSYKKLLQADIIPDCLFSIETHPIDQIDPQLYAGWLETCTENPPQYLITPCNVTKAIFELPARNRLGYYTVNYTNALRYAFKNDSKPLWGGRTVGTHMHQVALTYYAKTVLLGYDYCWYDPQKQRAIAALGYIEEGPCKEVETWQGKGFSTDSYMLAAKDQEKVLTLQTLFLRNTFWCSPGLKLRGIRRYTPFKLLIPKINASNPVEQLPDLIYRQES